MFARPSFLDYHHFIHSRPLALGEATTGMKRGRRGIGVYTGVLLCINAIHLFLWALV